MKKINNRLILFMAVCLLSTVAGLFTIPLKDTLIVNFGIHGYTYIKTALSAFSVAGLAGTCTYAVKKLMIVRKNRIVTEPMLKINSRLDPEDLRGRIYNLKISCKHKELKEVYAGIEGSMETMNRYQAKLNKLLNNNGADALRDSEEILDGVEQNLCRNVRKFLNKETILDTDQNYAELLAEGEKCNRENDTLLKKTMDFMEAVAEYLNDQDDNDDLGDIEIYKNAILEQIKEV